MTQPPPWPKSLTATIAGQIQRTRVARRMSAQQLAEATAALGYEIPRSVIANLESGRRDAVSIAELVVFAQALKVPPLLLVFPVGHAQTIEVLPNVTADVWAAAKWFTGEGPFPGTENDITVPSDSATTYFRHQDELMRKWRQLREQVAEASATQAPGNEPQKADFFAEWLRSSETHLRDFRILVRKMGFNPGELPPELAHVDEG